MDAFAHLHRYAHAQLAQVGPQKAGEQREQLLEGRSQIGEDEGREAGRIGVRRERRELAGRLNEVVVQLAGADFASGPGVH